MGKYQRILNRGACPRLMLEMFGATDKRDRAQDPNVIGVNGTGTKYAPAAASRLGIALHVSSHDERGRYYVGYDVMPIEVRGQKMDRIVMRYADYDFQTQYTANVGRVWDQPIGDDDKTTYRVLREYYSNGLDEDPRTLVDTVEREEDLVPAAPDQTVVYLSWHPEFQDMLHDHPERWFKRLSGMPPIFAVPGVGAIYPRSDPERTRVFCQGNLAHCVEEAKLPSCFDWSTDDKLNLSGDREFIDFAKAQADFHRLLLALDDERLARQLLAWALAHPNSLETQAFGKSGLFLSKMKGNYGLWAKAWHDLLDDPNGDEAIIANEYESDERARYGFRKKPVKVPHNMRPFLLRCGIKESRDFAPQMPQIAEVTPDAFHLSKFRWLLDRLIEEEPEAKEVEWFFYVPLTEGAKGNRGLTLIGADGKPIGRIGLQLGILASYRDLAHVMLHEMTHYLKDGDKMKHDLDFIHHEGAHRAKLFMEKKGIPDEPSVDVHKLPLARFAQASSATPETPARNRTEVEEALASIRVETDDWDDPAEP